MLYDQKWDLNLLSADGRKLWKAADYMEEHGWARGQYKSRGAVCLIGAILMANYRISNMEAHDLTARHFSSCNESVVYWNDNIAKDKEQVVAKLREMARKASNLD